MEKIPLLDLLALLKNLFSHFSNSQYTLQLKLPIKSFKKILPHLMWKLIIIDFSRIKFRRNNPRHWYTFHIWKNFVELIQEGISQIGHAGIVIKLFKKTRLRLCVLITSHTRFRVNLHSAVAWMSGKSLIKTSAISESDSCGSWTQNHLICKWTLNYLAKPGVCL